MRRQPAPRPSCSSWCTARFTPCPRPPRENAAGPSRPLSVPASGRRRERPASFRLQRLRKAPKGSERLRKAETAQKVQHRGRVRPSRSAEQENGPTATRTTFSRQPHPPPHTCLTFSGPHMLHCLTPSAATAHACLAAPPIASPPVAHHLGRDGRGGADAVRGRH